MWRINYNNNQTVSDVTETFFFSVFHLPCCVWWIKKYSYLGQAKISSLQKISLILSGNARLVLLPVALCLMQIRQLAPSSHPPPPPPPHNLPISVGTSCCACVR